MSERNLKGDEESALSKALKRSTKLIKRPITKADAEAYCKANGLVMVPEEPTWEIQCAFDNLTHALYPLDMSKRVYKAMIGAFKVQAL